MGVTFAVVCFVFPFRGKILQEEECTALFTHTHTHTTQDMHACILSITKLTHGKNKANSCKQWGL